MIDREGKRQGEAEVCVFFLCHYIWRSDEMTRIENTFEAVTGGFSNETGEQRAICSIIASHHRRSDMSGDSATKTLIRDN